MALIGLPGFLHKKVPEDGQGTIHVQGVIAGLIDIWLPQEAARAWAVSASRDFSSLKSWCAGCWRLLCELLYSEPPESH